MEKGFNDDELADIMSEIESLEQEFTDDQPEQVEAVQEQTESVEQEQPQVEEQPEEVVAQQEQEPQVQDEVVAQQEPVQEEVVAKEEPVQEEVVAKEEPVQEEVVAKEEPVQEQVVAKEESFEEVDEEMNEVLDELSEMPVEDVVPQHKVQSYDDNIHHMKQEPQVKKPSTWSAPQGQPAQTSMSFRVEGEMKLDLNFSIGGQDVNLQVTDHGFEIELAGGAKFTLPLGNQHQGKKAA